MGAGIGNGDARGEALLVVGAARQPGGTGMEQGLNSALVQWYWALQQLHCDITLAKEARLTCF